MGDRARYTVFGIAQACGLLSFFILTVFFCRVGGITWSNTTNFHGFFMVLSMVYLQGLAISVYRALPFVEHHVVKSIHGGLNFFVLAMAITGLIAALQKFSISSLHGALGIFTLILFASQWLIGFVTFLYPKLTDDSRARIVTYHRVLGVFIFLLALMVAMIGLSIYMSYLQSMEATMSALAQITGETFPNVKVYCMSAGFLMLFYCIFTVFFVRSKYFEENY